MGTKRFRYTGKEKDEKTGLYYHGARYCAPWLARWVNCDPLLWNGRISVRILPSLPHRFDLWTLTAKNLWWNPTSKP